MENKGCYVINEWFNWTFKIKDKLLGFHFLYFPLDMSKDVSFRFGVSILCSNQKQSDLFFFASTEIAETI